MSQGPAPLWEGIILDDRYAVEGVLGRGGFGITYRAHDLKTDTEVAIKELAPLGSIRGSGGELTFEALGVSAAERLRHQFTHEADILSRLRAPRVPLVRRTFHEHATGYMVTDFVPNARTLAEVQRLEGRLPVELVQSLCEDLLESLAVIHQNGLLHRDIKPANILITDAGLPYLIDFGSAREWHADFTTGHTVLFTPGFAPMEQMSDRATRGPGTDLYGLAATAYTLLTGSPPPSAIDRSTGQVLIPLSGVRPDVTPHFAAAIHQALELQLYDRPRSAPEMLRAIQTRDTDSAELESLRDLDSRRFRLQRFRFDSRQDPISGEPMEDPKPLSADACPVCREGSIRTRAIPKRTCPTCRVGIVHEFHPRFPIPICPSCHIGRMTGRKKLLSRKPPEELECPTCSFKLTADGDAWVDADGNQRTSAEWNELAQRAAHVFLCDACDAQFDEQADGRWRRMTPDTNQDGYRVLYPDEWARVGAGLNPGAGNASCSQCRADFFVERDTITLLADGGSDEFGFAAEYTGRLISRHQLPWLAVGKESGNPGLVGMKSGTEFDRDPGGWRLVRSRAPQFARLVGEIKTLENWHRVAQDLPEVGDEGGLEDQLQETLRDAVLAGEISFDAKAEHVVWKGKAQDAATGKVLKYELTTDGLTYGALRRKFIDLVDLEGIRAEGDDLWFSPDRGISEYHWVLDPVELTFRLESGRARVQLDAEDFAARLNRMLRAGRSAVS